MSTVLVYTRSEGCSSRKTTTSVRWFAGVAGRRGNSRTPTSLSLLVFVGHRGPWTNPYLLAARARASVTAQPAARMMIRAKIMYLSLIWVKKRSMKRK